MRTVSAAVFALAFASLALGQRASSDAEVLTIRISADGICYFLDTSAACDKLGEYLLSHHLAQNGHVHIKVDKFSRYETIAVTLESLRRSGFREKVGFISAESPH